MAEQKSKSLWDAKIIRRALVDSVVKLNPRTMMKNPVMFVVEVGSVVTTLLLFGGKQSIGFNLQITLWLWFTVLFANFAEAMAEGRGKAQADTLRKARSETEARRLLAGRHDRESCASSKLRVNDVVTVAAAELIPGDGEVIEGVASVDESAITGESAPVIREAGGDRSARHRRHARAFRSDQGSHHLQSRRNFPRPHDRPGRRRRAPEDAERDRAQHSARRAHDYFSAGSGYAAAVRHLLGIAADRVSCSSRCWSA